MEPDKQQPGFWQPNSEATAAYDPSTLAQPPEPQSTTTHANPLSWQASEYVHQEKRGVWFLGLILVAAALVAVSLFVIKSLTFAVLVVVMAITLVVISRRTPRVLSYQLTAQGLQIDQKLLSFHDFRAFGVMQEGPLYSVILLPSKRFMPGVNVYFPAEQGEHIVDTLGSVLPMEQVEPDFLDKIVHRLRI